MRALSLFSGIGGFDLAADRCGIEVVAQSEVDPKACELLAARWPQARQLGDIAQVSEEVLRGLGPVDIVFGGWPCQGNSVAGLRGGMDDARSGLWSEVVRVLACLKPRWFVGENVPGLLSVNRGRDFGRVIGDLDGLGYVGAWRTLDARYFGLAQRRRRVFLVASLGDRAGAAQVLLEPEGREWHPAASREAGEAVAGTLGGGSGERGWSPDTDRMTFVPELALALAFGAHPGGITGREAEAGHLVATPLTGQGNRQDDNEVGQLVFGVHASQRGEARLSPLAVSLNGSLSGKQYEGVVADSAVRRLTPLECTRLQGFPDDWLPDHFADGVKYRLLGNAVAVPVAAWVLRRLAAQP